MSINSSISVSESTSNLNTSSSQSFEAGENKVNLGLISVGTTEETVGYGDVANPRLLAIVNKSPAGASSLLVGHATGVYDQELAPGQSCLISLRSGDRLETQTVQTVADSADSLDGTYFTLVGRSGSWAVWIDTDDSGTTEPAHSQDNSVKVATIATDDTAATVAAAIAAVLQEDAAFQADFTVSYNAAVDDDLITITDRFIADRTNASAGTSGFTVATTQAGGSAARSVYLKGDTAAVDTLIGVYPR